MQRRPFLVRQYINPWKALISALLLRPGWVKRFPLPGLPCPFSSACGAFTTGRLIACVFGLALAFGFASDEEFSISLNSSISSSSVRSRHCPAGSRQADVHDARAFQLRHFITKIPHMRRIWRFKPCTRVMREGAWRFFFDLYTSSLRCPESARLRPSRE